MSLSVVTHASTTTAVAPPASVTVTPTAANQLIVVIVNCDTSNTVSISSIPSLNWIQQYSIYSLIPPLNYTPTTYYSMGTFMLVWYAISTSNSSITITIKSSSSRVGIEALVVDGANLNTPFETSSYPLTAISGNGVFSITATVNTMVAKNELIIAAVGKAIPSVNGVLAPFSLSASFGTLTFLDGNGSSPLLAYAYAITSNLLSNATITVTWASNPNSDVLDNPTIMVFAILPSSVTNYIPFGVVYNSTFSSPMTVTPTAAGQLIMILTLWSASNPQTPKIYSNPPLLWKVLNVDNNLFIKNESRILIYYTISTSIAPITINASGFDIAEIIIINGANTINPFDLNPSLPVDVEENVTYST